MPWTPLDDGLLTSTLLKEGPTTVAIWALILASCDRWGVSKLQPTAAASLLRITDKEAEDAFRKLSSPDKRSRNQDSEGRRIKQTKEGYWEVISHSKYQALASRAGAVARQQRYLERKKKAEAAAAGKPMCARAGCKEDQVPGSVHCTAHVFEEEESPEIIETEAD